MVLKYNDSPSGPRAGQKFPGVLFDGGTVSTVTVSIKTISVPGIVSTDVLVAANCVQKTGLAAIPSRVVSDGVAEILLINPTAASITTGTVTYTFSIQHFNV